MRNLFVLAIAAVFIVAGFGFDAMAVNTARIDVVRAKELLANSDTEIIEDFLAAAFREFLATTDFSEIATLRNAIVSRDKSEFESGQIQYGPRFFTIAQKEIALAFEKIAELPDNDQHKNLLTTNLLIIVNDLSNLEITKIAADYLQSPNPTIRYWAVCCLTNQRTLKQLNMKESAENNRLAAKIAEQLLAATENKQPDEIIIKIANFAAGLKRPEANKILDQITAKRVELYLNWQASDSLTESWLLQALATRPQTDPESKVDMARNFASLYSMVIQKYVLAQEILTPQSSGDLISVIVQGEKALTRFLPEWQGSLKHALEKGTPATLLAEQNALFGTADSAGKLPTAISFDYGKNPDGTTKTNPPQMQNPPK